MLTVLRSGIISLCICAVTAAPGAHKLTVAQILTQREALNGEIVEVQGNIRSSFELSSVEDGSGCAGIGKRPCKLAFGIGQCKIVGDRSRGSECKEALDKLMEKEGFPYSPRRSVVVKHVIIRGLISHVDHTIADPHAPPVFFHVFLAELDATELNLDNAVVERSQ